MSQTNISACASKKETRLRHYITLVIGLACVGIGQTLLYTILGPASREIGLTEFNVGLIVTIAALVITLCSGVWGKLIGVFGSRNSYLAGLIFYTVGTLFLALALKLSLNHYLSVFGSFTALLVIRCLTGALTAGIHPSAMTYVAENTSRSNRGAGMALLASAYGIGSVVGPLLGSSLGTFSLLLPIYIAAAISCVGTILGFIVLSSSEPTSSVIKENKVSVKLMDARVLPVFISITCTYIAFSAFQQTISFYIQDVFSLGPKETVAKTGVTISIMAVTMVMIQLGFIQVFKPSVKSLLWPGCFLCLLGYGGIILAGDLPVAINISAGMLGMGFGMMIPAIQSAASLAVSHDEQSGVAGFLFGASAFGYVLGPLIGTLIYSLNHKFVFIFAMTSIVLSTYFTSKVVYQKSNILSN